MKFLWMLVLSLFFTGICHAEIITVAVGEADLLSSPSQISYIVLKAPRYYPLSVQSTKGEYIEVRDFQGRGGWIHKSQVDHTKGIVVEVDKMNVRKGPGTNFPVLFKAYEGVAFKVLKEENRWLEVEHESGKRGWVARSLTWGR